eukprot:Sspe_Gene.34848::Locus_16919_Transcript_1_3_Confidence_0.300_Length_2138::g.34848::m.34848
MSSTGEGPPDAPLVGTSPGDNDALVQTHVVKDRQKLMAVEYKLKRSEDRKRRQFVLFQLCTEKDKVLLLQYPPDEPPQASSALCDVLADEGIAKVGWTAQHLNALLKQECGREGANLIDIFVMADEIVKAAQFKSFDLTDCPLSQGISYKTLIALLPPRKTPTRVTSANWETLDDERLQWASYESRAALEVYKVLSALKKKIDAAPGPSQVLIANLPDVTVDALKERFKGETMKKDPVIEQSLKNRSTAIATLFFPDKSQASSFIATYNHAKFREREMVMAENDEQLQEEEEKLRKSRAGRQVYLCNLPYFTTDHQIRNFFKNFAAHIIETRFFTVSGAGIGSALFDTAERAQEAATTHREAEFAQVVLKVETKKNVVHKRKVIVDLDLDYLLERHRQAQEMQGERKAANVQGKETMEAVDYDTHEIVMKSGVTPAGSGRGTNRGSAAMPPVSRGRGKGGYDEPTSKPMIMVLSKDRPAVGSKVRTMKQCGVPGFGRVAEKGSIGKVTKHIGDRIEVQLEDGSHFDLLPSAVEVLQPPPSPPRAPSGGRYQSTPPTPPKDGNVVQFLMSQLSSKTSGQSHYNADTYSTPAVPAGQAYCDPAAQEIGPARSIPPPPSPPSQYPPPPSPHK